MSDEGMPVGILHLLSNPSTPLSVDPTVNMKNLLRSNREIALWNQRFNPQARVRVAVPHQTPPFLVAVPPNRAGEILHELPH